ncbi:peptidase M50 [Calidifontibacter sp. DB0510]|uniref:Peptidase M50 n=1 Tax=Metallococcus carri TaxID=1656884 RepID=A0A967B553_9MICO|nr:M50 family metallopeptidase [Metallococcus carri]NHN54821.1 peptidase M50 [Metallococcus carri]NOP37166.1 peptidase M50 [Calidifontibacter sp. DB2511S]
MPRATPPTSGPGLRLFSLRGIPVFIGWSWLIITAVIVFSFGPTVREMLPELGSAAYLVAVAYAGLLLLSVLVHEGAHALVAQARGYQVQRIVADLWGGHTAYDNAESSPGNSALVAVVGPVSNALLAVAGYLALPYATGVPELLLGALTIANAFVAAFNLLPGLPLDGGFLVDALVWKVTGSRSKGLIVAGWCGRIVTAVVVIGLLVVPFLHGSPVPAGTAIWVVFIAGFLWLGAGSAIARGRAMGVVGTVSLRQLLRPVAAVGVGTPVDRLPAVDTALIDADGRPVGLIPAGSGMQVPFEARATTPAEALVQVQPPEWVCRAAKDPQDVTPLVEALQRTEGATAYLLVVDPVNGQPVGVARRDEVYRALQHAFGQS